MYYLICNFLFIVTRYFRIQNKPEAAYALKTEITKKLK